MLRVSLALLVLFTLTAFAPAPFPKVRRENRQQGSLAPYQGMWEVVSSGTLSPEGNLKEASWLKGIHITGDVLTFINSRGVRSFVFRITIDNTQKPATIDFYDTRDPKWANMLAMQGVIRQNGRQVEFLYTDATEKGERPASFEKPGVICGKVVLRRVDPMR